MSCGCLLCRASLQDRAPFFATSLQANQEGGCGPTALSGHWPGQAAWMPERGCTLFYCCCQRSNSREPASDVFP